MRVKDKEQVTPEIDDLDDNYYTKTSCSLLSWGDFLCTQMENWSLKHSPLHVDVVSGSNRPISILCDMDLGELHPKSKLLDRKKLGAYKPHKGIPYSLYGNQVSYLAVRHIIIHHAPQALYGLFCIDLSEPWAKTAMPTPPAVLHDLPQKVVIRVEEINPTKKFHT